MKISISSFTVFFVFSLILLGIFPGNTYAQVMKLYSDENSTQLEQTPINQYLDELQWNNDAIGTDTTTCYATNVDPEHGSYSLVFHVVDGPNPRLTFTTWDGVHAPLNATHTQKVTFWVKSKVDSPPLWFWVEDASYSGGAGQSAAIAIGGESVYADSQVVSDVPWNGKWQFVSLPWYLIQSNDTTYVKNTFKWSWTHTNENMDRSMIRHVQFDSGWDPPYYPYGHKTGVNGYINDFHIDEVYFVPDSTTGINDKKEVTPVSFKLNQNYPNPFNPSTTISYDLPTYATVNLTVYNMLGEVVRRLVTNKFSNPGTYNVTWNGKDDMGKTVASGEYIYRLQASHYVSTKKMIFLK